MKRRVLLVDDEPAMLYALRELLTDHELDVVTARDGDEALSKLGGADMVLTDLAMPGRDGLSLLRELRARDPSLPVVLLTAHGNEKVAVRAIKEGAFDYLTKPFDMEEVLHTVDRALEARWLRLDNRRLEAEAALGRRVIARSAAMQRVLADTARLADRDVTVLVRGETGTGKEVLATLLHAQGRRAKGPLVRFNCAAIPRELAEAELFGHAKGAFTGAAQARKGYFAQAHGGTLVLDEVGEMSLELQPKLLRALQEGEVQPVGAARVERVDVRVVASTNRDLAQRARDGFFREDLYYRLAVVELVLPPLRERRDDIMPLSEEFARRYADRFGLGDVRLAPALLDALTKRDWPGNVRELENTVARVVALSQGGELGPEALGALVPAAPKPSATHASEADEPAVEAGAAPSLREQVDAFERGLIVRALAATGGNQSEAARRLGASRATLGDKIKKYGLH